MARKYNVNTGILNTAEYQELKRINKLIQNKESRLRKADPKVIGIYGDEKFVTMRAKEFTTKAEFYDYQREVEKLLSRSYTVKAVRDEYITDLNLYNTAKGIIEVRNKMAESHNMAVARLQAMYSPTVLSGKESISSAKSAIVRDMQVLNKYTDGMIKPISMENFMKEKSVEKYIEKSVSNYKAKKAKTSTESYKKMATYKDNYEKELKTKYGRNSKYYKAIKGLDVSQFGSLYYGGVLAKMSYWYMSASDVSGLSTSEQAMYLSMGDPELDKMLDNIKLINKKYGQIEGFDFTDDVKSQKSLERKLKQAIKKGY